MSPRPATATSAGELNANAGASTTSRSSARCGASCRNVRTSPARTARWNCSASDGCCCSSFSVLELTDGGVDACHPLPCTGLGEQLPCLRQRNASRCGTRAECSETCLESPDLRGEQGILSTMGEDECLFERRGAALRLSAGAPDLGENSKRLRSSEPVASLIGHLHRLNDHRFGDFHLRYRPRKHAHISPHPR